MDVVFSLLFSTQLVENIIKTINFGSYWKYLLPKKI